MGDAPSHGTTLDLKAVGNITQQLFVPAYQRGYRWTEHEVTALLSDITEAPDKDYCLQPVVVKPMADGRFELIDGQQRLTTLHVLFTWMKKCIGWKEGAPYSIAYETRPRSAEFLETLDATHAAENIDFFHLHQAYDAIDRWFARHGHRRQMAAMEVYQRLFNGVKVIWYEVTDGVASTELFARLNVGRIPLTNAELVKALLLSRRGASAPSDDRRKEMGTQWDAIERDLQDDRLWYFLTNTPAEKYATRIELVFELMVDPPTTPSVFHTFYAFKGRLDAGEGASVIWDEVVARHAMLREWYEDRDLYHSLGYLISAGGPNELRRLIAESEGLTKSAFATSLEERIARRLNVAEDELEALSYDENKAACHRALLLFNIESTRALTGSFDRFPFHLHKGNQWSLEHIHAQNADELTTKAEWQSWLVAHGSLLREMKEPVEGASARQELAREIDERAAGEVTKETFDILAARVHTHFAEGAADDRHGIENLALLQKDVNSELNSAVFGVKRRRILQHDRAGSYLPICTRRVFLKYYTDTSDQQLHHWSAGDRSAYLAAMKRALGKYLTKSTGDT